MSYLLGIICLLLGLAIGWSLPDLDLRWRFLGHRSIVTHGFLVPLLFYALAYRRERPALRWLAMGVGLASAAHLCFDLFPRAWSGFALITVPAYGRTSPLFSWLWVAVSLVVCLYLALALIRNLLDLMVVVGGLALALGFNAAAQRSVLAPPLIVLGAGAAVALMLPSSASHALRRLRWRVARRSDPARGVPGPPE